jgi:hypothetical protein
MFAMVCGFLLALIIFGLPLGIIGLFVASILDQTSAWSENIPQVPPTLKGQATSERQFAYSRELVGTDAL